ncbi:hypothetical protein FSP39_005086, partial [Pinctada imbricata]
QVRCDTTNTYIYTCEFLYSDWVKTCWDGDFTEIEALDINVECGLEENNYHVGNLYSLLEVLKGWTSQREGTDGEGLWAVLVENDISYKDLIALLAYLIDKGHKRASSVQLKEAAILSGSCYIKLLTIPGSGAFKVFHPVLFEKCVDILKLCLTLGTSKRKRSSVSPGHSQSKKRSKCNKSKRSSRKEGSLEIDESQEEKTEGLRALMSVMMSMADVSARIIVGSVAARRSIHIDDLSFKNKATENKLLLQPTLGNKLFCNNYFDILHSSAENLRDAKETQHLIRQPFTKDKSSNESSNKRKHESSYSKDQSSYKRRKSSKTFRDSQSGRSKFEKFSSSRDKGSGNQNQSGFRPNNSK